MAMKILAKLKVRIPQDMAVIGYDNIDVASLITPSLTTFDQKNDEISKTIVNLLIKLIKEENISVEERNVIIEPLLIKRESA
jgi:DNA-binding LacI/PurR family transcriptional regulator